MEQWFGFGSELSMEFWGSEMLKGIVAEAGNPVAADEFTDCYRKMGLTRF